MKNYKIPFRTKQAFKRLHRKCQICGEEEYALLDVHRIIEKQDYSYSNCVCICTSCHRKQQANIIKIIKWVHTTSGRLLYYINEKGEEKYI
jgi:hypothetical protein